MEIISKNKKSLVIILERNLKIVVQNSLLQFYSYKNYLKYHE